MINAADNNALSLILWTLEQQTSEGRTKVNLNGIYGTTNLWGYLGDIEDHALSKRARHILLKESVPDAIPLIEGLRRELYQELLSIRE